MAAPLYKVTVTNGLPAAAADDGDVPTLAKFTPRIVQLVPTCDATACASGDVVAATEIWAAVTGFDDVGCYLVQLNVTRLDSATGLGLNIVLLKANSSIAAENAAFAVADADADDIIDIIPVVAADYTSLGTTNCIARVRNLRIPIIPVSGSDDIYVGIYCTEAVDLGAATDILLTGFFE